MLFETIELMKVPEAIFADVEPRLVAANIGKESIKAFDPRKMTVPKVEIDCVFWLADFALVESISKRSRSINLRINVEANAEKAFVVF